ncbi:HAD-IA family hydrolase [Acidobacteria bacterium AH-259-A15]|nr:HAD-IA family hydrolase [Acidobacteria bacterium AH-259-A15]
MSLKFKFSVENLNFKDTAPWAVDTVFFDAAGTLFQVRGSVGEIYGRYAAKFGFEGGEEESTWKEIQKGFVDAFRQKEPLVFPGEPKAAIAQLERQWWRELVQRTFAPLGPFPRIEEFFETLYSVFRTSQAWQLEPGCQELLSQLRKRGKKLGIISNFDSRIWDLLEDLEIRQYFDDVTVSSLAPAAKPSPVIFRHALAKLGSEPQRSVHIGDDIGHDFEGARAAGLFALLYDPRDRFAAELPTHRIRCLAEASSFLI